MFFCLNRHKQNIATELRSDTLSLFCNPLTHNYLAINDLKNGGEIIEVTHSLVSKRKQEGQRLMKNTLLICIH